VNDALRRARDDDFVTVARVGDVAPGTGKTVLLGRREVALFNAGGRFYALDNTCPHQGGPLSEGWIEGETVTCPWHAWCFTMRDGKMTLGDYAQVDTFDVRIEGDEVRISRVARPD
jgi:NAD(P)H-dependent nitrite reductase small subunit